MNIEKLKDTLTKSSGLARTNRYDVVIPGLTIKDQFVLVESVSIPGRTLATDEVMMQKQAVKMIYTFMDEPVTIVFLLTNDYYVKKFFDGRFEKTIDTKNYRLKYKNTYSMGDITINQLNRNNEVVYSAVLENAYPIAMNSIELSNTSENDVVRLSVTFSYEKYRIIN